MTEILRTDWERLELDKACITVADYDPHFARCELGLNWANCLTVTVEPLGAEPYEADINQFIVADIINAEVTIIEG